MGRPKALLSIVTLKDGRVFVLTQAEYDKFHWDPAGATREEWSQVEQVIGADKWPGTLTVFH